VTIPVLAAMQRYNSKQRGHFIHRDHTGAEFQGGSSTTLANVLGTSRNKQLSKQMGPGSIGPGSLRNKLRNNLLT
jgi:hypothetical protein